MAVIPPRPVGEDGGYNHDDDECPESSMTTITETIQWMPAAELPDSDSIVLITCTDGDDPVWLGYYDGTEWLTVEGAAVKVSHWAEMPAGGKDQT
jgi:hypothetical protein